MCKDICRRAKCARLSRLTGRLPKITDHSPQVRIWRWVVTSPTGVGANLRQGGNLSWVPYRIRASESPQYVGLESMCGIIRPLIESSNIVRILRKLSDWSSKAAPRHGSAGITCSSATACNGLWDKVLRACGCLSTPGIAARGSTCVCLLVPQPGRAGRRLRLCMAGPYVATKYISGFQFKVGRIQILPTCTWSEASMDSYPPS